MKPDALPVALTALLKLGGVALLYLAIAELTPGSMPEHGEVRIIWPASGLGLAVLMLGGRRYLFSVVLGALLFYSRRPDLSMPAIAGLALVPALEAYAGDSLMRRAPGFSRHFNSFRDFRQLLMRGAFSGAGVGALSAVTALLITGQIKSGDGLRHLAYWWMGDVLGIVLLTPFILVWGTFSWRGYDWRRALECLLIGALALSVGQIVFLDWFQGVLGPLARGHWLFLVMALVGVRLGIAGAVAVLPAVALQSLTGIHQGIGFFAKDIESSGLINYWFYVLVLSIVGIAFTTYFHERKRIERDLRVSAIAFECHDGIVVMDADFNILRVNRAFMQITGYAQHEIQGGIAAFLKSERHPAAFYEAIWREARLSGKWHGDLWHRRKRREHYLARITMTAVTDERRAVTHYVGYLTDATNLQLQEQERLLNEAAHRNVLVREVHHRIKNNLHGIMGMLRRSAQKNPEVAATINQAIGQVQSISVIHGLQGRVVSSSVRLCELTGAIADEIQTLWQTRLNLEIPPDWQPCLVAEAEAVPIALVLNELILNAVKHGGKERASVSIELRKGSQADIVHILISNAGTFSNDGPTSGTQHSGLQLIAALMPASGAAISREQRAGLVFTMLEVGPPVISLDLKEMKEAR
ncbi:MAG: MASE1 domain-containing protein [Burkholderiales bacterium]|nr:MASE1 domain-containing protein [Burkholderiales bacterium]